MALITCPKCGKHFSEHAKNCPHCGLSKGDALAIIEKREEEIRLATEREAAERERQRQEYFAEQERLQKEREEREEEAARIRAGKRAEWWKKNGKKVKIAITILFVIVLSTIVALMIKNAIQKKRVNQHIEATFAAGDSCVANYAFEEAEKFYHKALEYRNDSKTEKSISRKMQELNDARKKTDDEYAQALRQLQILLDADDNVFNQYSNQCLEKMIQLYPNKKETIDYKNLRDK